MPQKRYVIVIGGPTAIGKTTTAIRVANHFGIEIISADSRQFYKEMTIGTAKPTPAELAQAPHHFINTLSIHDQYTVGDYERDVLKRIEQLQEGYEATVLVGGSGLFIRAICEGLDEFPPVPEEVRLAWIQAEKEKGIGYLQEQLKIKDPNYYEQVDIQNPHRLIRALSVIAASGQTFSSFRNQAPKERPFEIIKILLEMDRPILYDRINRRVDLMMAAGLEEEARSLYPLRHLNALQTVGYEELFNYFDGTTTLEKAVELIKRNSRRYAKRQMTWFRKREGWNRFAATDTEGVLQFLENKFLTIADTE